MQIWLFNPPTDRLSVQALQTAGVSTIVTSGKTTDMAHENALYNVFDHYAMIHVFTSTAQTEDQAIDIHQQPVQWFNSGCPNSPTIRRRFYAEMERLLAQPIRGVFLDGVRFSSPDSSTNPTSFLSCFCSQCKQDMTSRGYDALSITKDVQSIAEMLCSPELTKRWLKALYSPSGWMSLQMAYPGLADWLNYRVDCITEFVQELAIWMKARHPHKELAAFLFQPCLAYFVGQGYNRLSPHLKIVSPMIYRNYQHRPGPATINQEIATMARFVHEASRLPFSECIEDLLRILGPKIDGDVPQDPQGPLAMSIEHATDEVLAATALAGSQDKVVPIIWAGDPKLRQILAELRGIGLKNCILFTYEAGLASHGEGFNELYAQG